ncbi:unnamed protein product [Protopolystoma xenopodis]|uniref:Uncharacterized protein n=1 Tax=Protopolystoma xenopodis TaxID=117903 RepID=A0A3S5BV31_9PLAT|nr:unnamed protein product [Protopolystoma xenopodis]
MDSFITRPVNFSNAYPNFTKPGAEELSALARGDCEGPTSETPIRLQKMGRDKYTNNSDSVKSKANLDTVGALETVVPVLVSVNQRCPLLPSGGIELLSSNPRRFLMEEEEAKGLEKHKDESKYLECSLTGTGKEVKENRRTESQYELSRDKLGMKRSVDQSTLPNNMEKASTPTEFGPNLVYSCSRYSETSLTPRVPDLIRPYGQNSQDQVGTYFGDKFTEEDAKQISFIGESLDVPVLRRQPVRGLQPGLYNPEALKSDECLSHDVLPSIAENFKHGLAETHLSSLANSMQVKKAGCPTVDGSRVCSEASRYLESAHIVMDKEPIALVSHVI